MARLTEFLYVASTLLVFLIRSLHSRATCEHAVILEWAKFHYLLPILSSQQWQDCSCLRQQVALVFDGSAVQRVKSVLGVVRAFSHGLFRDSHDGTIL